MRMSRTKEDTENGFNRNTIIIDMKTVRSTLPPYYLEGAYPVRIESCKDSKCCNDTFSTLYQKKKDIESVEVSEEVGKTIVAIPAIPTKQEHLDELQDKIFKTFKNYITCPNCGYREHCFYMKNHVC